MEDIVVGEVMTKSPVTADIGDTVSDVMAMLKRYRVREVPVLKDGLTVGLISYSSLIQRRSLSLSAKAENIMLPVPKMDVRTPVLKAAELLMATGVGGAPVRKRGKMVGFVSRSDLIGLIMDVEELSSRKVDEVMTKNPLHVSPDDLVRSGQIMMENLDEEALPVVKSGNLVGVIGMSELMNVMWSSKADRPPRSPKPPRQVFDSRSRMKIQISSVMTRTPVCVSPQDDLGTVAKKMVKNHLSTIFVTDDKKLVGVIDQTDLLEQMIGLIEREQVFVQISGIGFRDPDIYDSMYSIIGRGMKRMAKMETPKLFFMHVSEYDTDGLQSKCSIGARLTTAHSMYYVSASGWDLLKTTSDMLETLEGKVRTKKDKRVGNRRKRSS